MNVNSPPHVTPAPERASVTAPGACCGDTNHLESEIRAIALGRTNWHFCWTEVGAECVGIYQSLLGTCRLQGVDPYTHLVDVMQRVEIHPAADVAMLTPRLWKEHFAGQPLPSDLDARRKAAAS